ncbi:T6SS immunity protein Tli4 family protein [Massilia glaciei]|uniref:T6SS immunity protein Tli4 family protein n=1 Tax=Massilia glaciei TaxID=1524097 RepID=UPI0011B24E57|nr:T6SS immunity protein Tli4 family protein [Massilia glaciei]
MTNYLGINAFAVAMTSPAILLTAALSLCACDSPAQSTKRSDMTPLSPRLQTLFEKTRTVCFGRFVMTIPVTATLVYGPANVEHEINRYADASGELAHRLAEHLDIVEGKRELLHEEDIVKFPLFGKVVDGVLPGQKVAFGSSNRVGYTMYSFIPVGKDLFVQHSNNVRPDADEILVFNRVASNLRSRSESEIPAEPGICINGGFIPLEVEYEKITVGVRLKEFPDVHFSVEVQKNRERLAETGRLELMLDEAKEEAEQRGLGAVYARIKTFRRGPRQLGAWQGFEFVSRRPVYKRDTEAHEFHFESLGALYDPLQPRLDVRLDSGVIKNKKASVKPSITDEEAIELWDRLLESIRIRGTSGGNPGTGEKERTPLGKLTISGGTCSQDGRWRSNDSGGIEGGARRHFAFWAAQAHRRTTSFGTTHREKNHS